ncbi:MAG: efflux RND transporter periplasmic adaptor subunit [Pelagibacterales bacterium]|nr:efflux RND transporter periplasmic adaptor subunit [Pelagibacterales bacterium]
MKKLIITLSLILLFSCNSSRNSSINDLINKGDLKTLKKKKTEYVDQMNDLRLDLNEINKGITLLDENEQIQVISKFSVTEKEFKTYVKLQANLKTRKNVVILSEFQGPLKNLFVREGQLVKQGQLLAEINDSGLKEQLDQMLIQANFTKDNFDRVKRLWEKNIGSEMQFLKAKSDFETSNKMVEQIRDQLSKTKVYAPFDGEIDEIISNLGSNLLPGSPMLRVVNLDIIYAEAQVPEKYVSSIELGTEAIVSIPLLGKEVTSKIIQSGNFINPNSRTFRIEVPVENKDKRIKQNLNARIKIKNYSNLKALVVPLRVLREDAGGKSFIYKLVTTDKEDIFLTVKSFVETGNNDDKEIEIIKGVSIGDIIVLEGANNVEDNQRVRLIE